MADNQQFQNPLEGTTSSFDTFVPAPEVQEVVDAERNKIPTDLTGDAYKQIEMDAYFDDFFSPTQDNSVAFSEYSTPMAETHTFLNSGDAIANYDNFLVGSNNEERLAKQQTRGEKWSNGLKKWAGKTGTAALGGTYGFVDGIIRGISEGSLSATYDNDFTHYMDDLNTRMDKKLPNYYTEYERNLNFWQSMGTANFWANDVLSGASFTTGMILSEGIWAFLTGGASLTTAIARGAARKALKGASYISTGKALAKVKSGAFSLAKKEAMYQAAKKGSKLGYRLNTARFLATSAGYEAGVESFHFLKEAKENFIYSFEQENGRAPNAAELAEFGEEAVQRANYVYASNMAILGVSNLAMFGKMFRIKSPIKSKFISKKMNETLYGIGNKEVTQAGKKVLETIKPNIAQKTLGITSGIVRPMLIEGVWEEGNQAIASGMQKNMLEHSYSQENSNDVYGVMEAMGDAFSHTYGTKEGFKEVGIGMIIGLLSGGIGGSFTETRDRRKQADYNTSYYNTHGMYAFSDRVGTAVQDLNLKLAEEKAVNRNDITGAKIAVDAAIISSMNAEHRMGNLDNSTDKFSEMIADISAEEMENMSGISAKNPKAQEQAKQEIVEAYNTKLDNFKKNREFAEQMVGENNLAKVVKGVTLDNELLISSITHNLTMAEGLETHSREILDELKATIGEAAYGDLAGVSETLELGDVLRKASTASKQKRKELFVKKAALSKRKKVLEEKSIALTNETYTEENRNAKTKELERVKKELAQVEADLDSQVDEEIALGNTMVMENPFHKANAIIDSDALMEVMNRLEAIDAHMENIKETNPQAYAKYSQLRTEYQKADAAFKAYNETVSGLTNPAFKTKKTLGLIPRIFHDGTPFDKFSRDFIIKTAAVYQSQDRTETEASSVLHAAKIKREEEIETPTAETVAARMNNNLELDPKEEEFYGKNRKEVEKARTKLMAEKKAATKVNEPTKLEQLKEQLNKIIKGTIGIQNIQTEEDIKSTEPNQEEIDEYNQLLADINEDAAIKDKNQAVHYSPRYFQRKGVKVGLTPTQLARFQKLNQKMADWRTVENAVDEDGTSIKQILDNIAMLEKEVTSENTNDITDEQIQDIPLVSETEAKEDSDIKTILQTPEIAKLRVEFDKGKPKFKFSLLYVDSFLKQLPKNAVITVKAANEKVGTEATQKRIDSIGTLEGTIFTVMIDDISVTIKIEDKGRVVFSQADFINLQKYLNFKIPRLIFNKSGYYDVYEVNPETYEGIPRLADFKLETERKEEAPVFEIQEIYKLKKGDKVNLVVDMKDSYNAGLIKKLKKAYKENKGTQEMERFVKENIHIYVYSGNKVIGTVKAGINDETTNPEEEAYNRIRQKASDSFLDAMETGKDRVDLETTLSVKAVLKGTPKLVIQMNGDIIGIKQFKITKKNAKSVKHMGYVDGKGMHLSGNPNTDKINTNFLAGFKKKEGKTPIVVIEHEGFLFAYPVSLKTETIDLSKEVIQVLNSNLSHAEKATAINTILSDNNMNMSRLGVTPLPGFGASVYNADNTPTQHIQDVLKELEQVKRKPDVETWTLKLDKGRLASEATISIDLDNRPLIAPKVVLDFKSKEATETELEEIERDSELANVKPLETEAKEMLEKPCKS